jgi:metal-responsive CopG/Arc/MetJ family transcriptional regulator
MKIMSVSIDEGLYRRLKIAAGNRGMSRFIAEAVREKLRDSESRLIEEYRTAQNDPDRQQIVEDWDAIEAEGW